MTPEEVAVLVTQTSITPNLKLIVRRDHDGHPIDQMRIRDVRAGLRVLRAAIDQAEKDIS